MRSLQHVYEALFSAGVCLRLQRAKCMLNLWRTAAGNKTPWQALNVCTAKCWVIRELGIDRFTSNWILNENGNTVLVRSQIIFYAIILTLGIFEFRYSNINETIRLPDTVINLSQLIGIFEQECSPVQKFVDWVARSSSLLGRRFVFQTMNS